MSFLNKSLLPKPEVSRFTLCRYTLYLHWVLINGHFDQKRSGTEILDIQAVISCEVHNDIIVMACNVSGLQSPRGRDP